MPKLDTNYMGLNLRSPIVASPSPMTGDVESATALARAGAGALVLPSLFEEEILHEETELDEMLQQTANSFAEALDYYPDLQGLVSPTEKYLENLTLIKNSIDIPVIGSLNATTSGGWTRYALMMQEAGADAIELNLYAVPRDSEKTGSEYEIELLSLIKDVRRELSIPLAVKLSPYFSNVASFSARAVEAGAKGLVLFNRFYQPDLDIDSLEVIPRLELSNPFELRLPLRWIASLYGELSKSVSLAATSGIHSGEDVAKALLAGATVAMTTSAVLKNGPKHIESMENDLVAWMYRKEYESVEQLRGSVSKENSDNPEAFERANYLRVLRSWATSSQN